MNGSVRFLLPMPEPLVRQTLQIMVVGRQAFHHTPGHCKQHNHKCHKHPCANRRLQGSDKIVAAMQNNRHPNSQTLVAF